MMVDQWHAKYSSISQLHLVLMNEDKATMAERLQVRIKAFVSDMTGSSILGPHQGHINLISLEAQKGLRFFLNVVY